MCVKKKSHTTVQICNTIQFTTLYIFIESLMLSRGTETRGVL
jgi:hypothetical protein